MRKLYLGIILLLSFVLFLHAQSPGTSQQGWVSCTQANCASSATTFLTTTTTSLYRIDASVNCTSATAAATAILTLKYTDPSSTVQTITVPTATCTTLGTASLAFLLQSVAIQTGTNVQYSVVAVNAPSYQTRVAVFQEGVN